MKEEEKISIEMLKSITFIDYQWYTDYKGEAINDTTMNKVIETVLNLIETQKAEIEKRDNQLKEKDNIINKTSLEAQRYFDTTIEQALRFDKELENKDRIINLMAEQLTTPIHSKEWIIEYYRKLAEGANHD